jgi:hypothetical protein
MNKFKKFITARRISLGLILLIAGLMYVSTLIPQKIDSSPGNIDMWRLGHNRLIWLVDGLQLHRIYAQPWFAAAILFAALTMGISCFDQWHVARRKLSATGIAATDEIAKDISEEHLRSVAHMYSYRVLQSAADDLLKYVRNPWGYFGNLLLHSGMCLVITASLYVALTGRQGSLLLVEGEQPNKLQALNFSEHGLLSEPMKLLGTIRLDKVRVSFSADNQPADVFSDLSISDKSGQITSLTASINRIQHYLGLRIYHAAQYGDAFTVAFTDKAGVTHNELIMVQQPLGLDKAGYCDEFAVSWSPYRFAAKYYADVDRKSMFSSRPELVVRALDGQKEISRTSLTPGNSGVLGGYPIRLNRVDKWAKLIIVDLAGMPIIFAGFAIIMLGGLIHYMTPPRELIGIRQHDGSCRVYWKATVFREFFKDERDAILSKLNKENSL